MTASWDLVVARGPDAGARLRVAARVVVGRARGAELLLTDRTASRRHVELAPVDDGLTVTLCEGAAPFVLDGAEATRGVLKPGGTLVLGSTVLSITRAADAVPLTEITSVHTLLDGLADDVRGLAAVHALVEVIDAAQDRDAFDAAVAGWAERHASAVETRVLNEPARPADLVVEPEGAGARLVAPGALSVVVARAPADVGLGLRRLVAVAGRVVGASLARLTRATAAEAEARDLRQLAVGSARAFLGDSPAAAQVAKLVPRLAGSDACVLLLGESGTGKTFVARLLHEAGPRAREPFRVLNCAAIPEGLVESELFGHERGAFTSAVASRAGAFEAAGRGTVLLDEIGELPLTSQAKLLRVLEDRRFERLGSNRTLPLEARVLAATNRDLDAMAAAGTFRKDLLFRISVIQLRVPALRERGEDVVLLAKRMLADLAPSAGRRVDGFSPAAALVLRVHPWPGNVRELRNAIEHALVLGDGPLIEPADLPEAVRGGAAAAARQPPDPDVVRLPASLADLEERAIQAALRATGGNRTRAAALLGINRVTLYKKLKEEPG